MPGPGHTKGHPNYNTSKDLRENGGFFGRHEQTYTDEELHELGRGVVEYMEQEGNIWMKGYFAYKHILWTRVNKLEARCPFFHEYLNIARSIQESKLAGEPYDKTKNKDAAHARFILARHHKGEWEDKNIVVANEQQKANLENTMSLVDHLQSNNQKQTVVENAE